MENKKCEEWIAEMTDTDNEIWSGDIEGNSREDVIADGIKYAKEYGLSSFRIGECIPVDIPSIYVHYILEDAYETLYNEVGECAEGFLENVPEDYEKELEDKLNEVFYDWIKKHRLEPNCYKIINDEFIEVE